MKKIVLTLGIAFFTLSSFTTTDSAEEVNNCAELAWDAATKWCKKRGGCSDYQEWLFTDIAYEECTKGPQ